MTPKELTQADVLHFLELQTGSFTTNQIKEYLNIQTPKAKNTLYHILSRLEEKEIQQLSPGLYRKRNSQKILVEWEKANPNQFLDLVLPFDLQKFCKLYPKSIVVVAGSKSAGKTTFLLDTAVKNWYRMPVEVFNSETGPEQLNAKFTALACPTPCPFPVYQCYQDFSDQIDPDKLSIIDYLDYNSEVYHVGLEIDNIFRKLNKGCAIIGIQKPLPSISIYKGQKQVLDRDLGYGGTFSIKRAALYISMSSHKLKIVDCKTPAQPTINPNGKQWTYKFSDKGLFKDITEYYEVTNEDNNV